MRYLKVLVLAIFFFFALVFFFQNQGPLSQEMPLQLNLFFIPPITTMPLPFYFLVIGAFLIGCLLSLAFLFWDKCTTSARLVRTRWKVSSLRSQVEKLTKELDSLRAVNAAEVQAQGAPVDSSAPEKSNAPAVKLEKK